MIMSKEILLRSPERFFVLCTRIVSVRVRSFRSSSVHGRNVRKAAGQTRMNTNTVEVRLSIEAPNVLVNFIHEVSDVVVLVLAIHGVQIQRKLFRTAKHMKGMNSFAHVK